MCCREKAVHALAPQRLTACCHLCVDTSVRSVQEPVCSLLSSLQGTNQQDAPRQTPLVCKPERGRGPAGAHRLGNDEVANLQEGSGTHSAFWTLVTFAWHFLSSFAKVLGLLLLDEKTGFAQSRATPAHSCFTKGHAKVL